MLPSHHRFGFVAVTGRPNVGKSTLVNRILGRELSIVTSKPQTTRHRIAGIHTLPDAQMVLLDTPGIHEAMNPLNRSLVAAAEKALSEADLVLLVTVPEERVHEHDLRVMELITLGGSRSILAINKIDTVRPEALLPVIDAYSRAHAFEEIIPISALDGSGVDELMGILRGLLPEGPSLYPEDDLSDLPVRFFVSEIIREQIIKGTGEEIPYRTTVIVESFKERDGRVIIQADIHAEKDSQKRILVGKGGSMIKRIGTEARKKIEAFLDSPVRLELFVKVTHNWTRSPSRLKDFGYDS